jgi:hypothetical protein
MKIVNLVLAVMFLVFAFVQINDPDPFHWILIYGAMAVICVMAAFRYYPRVFMIVMLIIYVAYSLVFLGGVKIWLTQPDKAALFDDVAKMQNLYIEESREFLGLWICIFVLIMQLILSRRRNAVDQQ